jgi:hypothetical protein
VGVILPAVSVGLLSTVVSRRRLARALRAAECEGDGQGEENDTILLHIGAYVGAKPSLADDTVAA